MCITQTLLLSVEKKKTLQWVFHLLAKTISEDSVHHRIIDMQCTGSRMFVNFEQNFFL